MENLLQKPLRKQTFSAHSSRKLTQSSIPIQQGIPSKSIYLFIVVYAVWGHLQTMWIIFWVFLTPPSPHVDYRGFFANPPYKPCGFFPTPPPFVSKISKNILFHKILLKNVYRL